MYHITIQNKQPHEQYHATYRYICNEWICIKIDSLKDETGHRTLTMEVNEPVSNVTKASDSTLAVWIGIEAYQEFYNGKCVVNGLPDKPLMVWLESYNSTLEVVSCHENA